MQAYDTNTNSDYKKLTFQNYFFLAHQRAPKNIPDKRSHCHAVLSVGIKRIAINDKPESAPKIKTFSIFVLML